jgi:beta-lactamase regulating signal transducer with metallopeptidase domain
MIPNLLILASTDGANLISIFSVVFHLSAQLAIAGCIVALLTRWRPLANPNWHRLAWGMVLFQGLVLFPSVISFTLPEWTSGMRSWVSVPPGKPVASIPTRALSSSRDPVAVEARTIESFQLSGDVKLEKWQPLTPIFDRAATEPGDPIRGSLQLTEQRVALLDHAPLRLEASELSESSTIPDAFTDSANAKTQQTIHKTTRRRSLADVRSQLTWPQIAFFIWLAGVSVVLVRTWRNYAILRKALSACQPARPRWTEELVSLCAELNIRRPIRLEVHPQLGPFLCWLPGGLRIVVPVRLWNRFPKQERIAVLHHELCHLRRGDLWMSAMAHFVVALHWFNPLAWLSAKRFDESAEWACDELLARESPTRVSVLANALLTAVRNGHDPQALAFSATGGELIQRIRRLVSASTSGDSIMRRMVWFGLLGILLMVALTRPRWDTPTLAADDVNGNERESVADVSPSEDERVSDFSDASQEEHQKAMLEELAGRLVKSNPSLETFSQLIKTPTGQLLMADRAAIVAGEATQGVASHWQQFIEKHFDHNNGRWTIKSTSREKFDDYVKQVELARVASAQIGNVFQSVAAQIDETSEIASVLQRFLTHEAAGAFVYHTELRGRIHPGREQLEQNLQDYLVRTSGGAYMIRPARRALVERRLELMKQLSGPLGRCEKEMRDWADDIVSKDDQHKELIQILRHPEFAMQIVMERFNDETPINDEALADFFNELEEATDDTARGAVIRTESDEYKELRQKIDRFTRFWNDRDKIREPLHAIADQRDEKNDLHKRLIEFLKSDLGLMYIAKSINYELVDADAAAHEWLGQIVTRNEKGRFEVTVESTEDLTNRLNDFFRQFRETRRRGRLVEEFAGQIEGWDELPSAMCSLPGKYAISRLIEQAGERPDVDGLAIWIEQHFEETPDGLVAREGAMETIEQLLNEAVEFDKDVARRDF